MKKKLNINQLIEEEYMMHGPDDDDEMYQLKEALKNALNPLERKIFITYLECGTYSATAKLFKVSKPTVSKYVNNLKNKIIEYVDNYMASATDKPDNDDGA